jgi:hypothetical protein
MSIQVYDIGDTVQLYGVFTTLATRGTIAKDFAALTVRDVTGYAPSDPIIITGAGAVEGDLVTTIVSIVGSTLNLAAVAQTSVTAAFLGKLSTPTTVTCKVLLPDGTIVTPANAAISTGRYLASYDPTLVGDHFYKFAGTGLAKAEDERQFVVRENRVS